MNRLIFGYISDHARASGSEISDFLDDLQELGIGDEDHMPKHVKCLHQDFTATQGGTVSFTPAVLQQKLSQEWVPLELCFGIPLFSDEANRHVCEKVIHSKVQEVCANLQIYH